MNDNQQRPNLIYTVAFDPPGESRRHTVQGTGIADIIGRQVMKLGGTREITMIIVIMVTGAVLSAFMNNIGVAALMLPVVVDVARRTRIPASRLLMPLAYSTLLGGLMTQIGTPPNLLISESLTRYGLETFKLFDFTPLGGAVMAIGVIFVALFGRMLLPKQIAEHGRQISQPQRAGQLLGHQNRIAVGDVDHVVEFVEMGVKESSQRFHRCSAMDRLDEQLFDLVRRQDRLGLFQVRVFRDINDAIACFTQKGYVPA